jgi:Haem-binding domain
MQHISLKGAVLGLAFAFVAIQVYRPARTNPPADPARAIGASAPLSPAVHAILRRACYDCHSNLTVWPWYSGVAPVSWLVIHDVNHGRTRMNFSEWGTYSASQRNARLEEICERVTSGDMPILAYKLMHPEARLSGNDVQAICRWTKSAPAQQTESGADTGSGIN